MKLPHSTTTAPVDGQDVPTKTFVDTALLGGQSIETLLDQDFIAAATQDIKAGGNGTFTIGGVTWNVDDVANASVLDIDGTGLRINNNTTNSVKTATTRDTPRVFLFPADVPGMPADMAGVDEIRFWSLLVRNTASVNFASASVGWCKEPFVTNASWLQEATSVFVTTDRFWGIGGNVEGTAGVSGGLAGFGDFDTGNDVVCCVFHPTKGVVELRVGKSVNGSFPAYETLLPMGHGTISGNNRVNQLPLATDAGMFLLSGTNGDTGGTNESTWSRVRVDIVKGGAQQLRGGIVTIRADTIFANLATQDLISGGDGVKTIDGRTWNLRDSAKLTSADITNGVGLVLVHDNTSSVLLDTPTSRTGARLDSFLSDLGVPKKGVDKVRMWWRLDSAIVDNNGQRIEAGLYQEPVISNDSYAAGAELQDNSGLEWLIQSYSGATQEAAAQGTQTLAEFDVMCIEMGLDGQGRMMLGTSTNGEWPAFSDLTFTGPLSVTRGGSAPFDLDTNIAAFLGGRRFAGSSDWTITWGRFKCETVSGPVSIPANSIVLGPGELLNVDFRTLPTQDLIAGGTFTIDGKTYYVDNEANASKLTVTNGIGLEIDSNGNDAFGSTTRDSPLVGIKLTDIDPSAIFQDLSFVRLWIIFSTVGLDANFERFTAFFENKQDVFASGSWQNWQGFKQNNSGNIFGAISGFNGGLNQTPNSTDFLSDDVMMLKLYSAGYMEFYTGVSVGGDFPSSGAMRLRCVPAPPSDLAMRIESEEMAVGVTTCCSSAANLQGTITRMKVDAK